MRRTVTALAVAAATAATLLLAGCAGASSPSATAGGGPKITRVTASPTIVPATPTFSAATCPGVFVTVQFGLLKESDITGCAKTTAPITAATALKAAGVTTAGTQKYGDQVVCRVNGEPSASDPISIPGHAPYTEKCQSMPAAFAYWAVWVRASADGQWGYAQSGVATQEVKPGETLGLKFTTGTDTTPPQG